MHTIPTVESQLIIALEGGQISLSSFWLLELQDCYMAMLQNQSWAMNGCGGYKSTFLNDFDVLEVLGACGACCVFKAENRNDGFEYAIKRIAVQASEAKITEALREVRALAQLEHAGIVRHNSAWLEEPPEKWQNDDTEPVTLHLSEHNYVREKLIQYKADKELLNRMQYPTRSILSYKYDDVFIYIQMQLCNQSLESWLAVNQTISTRPLALMKHWFKQMVYAVAYIHEKGFVHRNLKPSNIMFVDENRLKVCDFGLATEQKLDDGEEVDATRTRRESQMFMSPEQSMGKYSSKTDVYALGLIFAELCVVMSPSQRTKFFEYCRRETPHHFIEDLATAEFVETLTNVDPQNRPTCIEILNLPFLS